jgi:hypothetical protein
VSFAKRAVAILRRLVKPASYADYSCFVNIAA